MLYGTSVAFVLLLLVFISIIYCDVIFQLDWSLKELQMSMYQLHHEVQLWLAKLYHEVQLRLAKLHRVGQLRQTKLHRVDLLSMKVTLPAKRQWSS